MAMLPEVGPWAINLSGETPATVVNNPAYSEMLGRTPCKQQAHLQRLGAASIRFLWLPC